MKQTLLLLLLLSLCTFSFAAIDTVSIYSGPMFKHVKCVVVTPTAYTGTDTRFPVVYLLHGYSGDYSNWVTKVPNMQQLADENQLMIVCPDGSYSSWYFDSPVDLTSRYETNVAIEIPTFIDSMYRTISTRTGRAIAGLSMGGHGALFLTLRHSGQFGACSSMSGGLDISKIKTKFDLPKVLGDSVVNASYYESWSVVNLVEKFPSEPINLLIDCGTSDMFYDMNKRTHEKLLNKKIPHTYVERAGGHSWDYWTSALPYHLLFFRQYFATVKEGK